MWTSIRRRQSENTRERERERMLAASQKMLHDAAISTVDLANHVTTMLRQELRDTALQLETTMHLMLNALLVVTESGMVSACNAASETLFGTDRQALINRPVMQLFEHDGAADWPTLRTVLAAPQARGTRVVRGRRQDGQSFPITASLAQLAKVDGTIIILILVRDDGDRVRAQHLDDLHRTQLRTQIETSFDGIVIVQQNKIVAANNAAVRMLGKPSADGLLGASFADVVAVAPRLPPPTGRTIVSEVTATDTQLQMVLAITPMFWNDHAASLILLRDLGHANASVDLWPRQDNRVDMICTSGPDLRIRFANQPYCAYYGLDQKQLAGRALADTLLDIERDEVLRGYAELTPAQPARRVRVQRPQPDGTVRLQDWIDQAIFDADGQLVEHQRTGRDITDMLANLLTAPPANVPPTRTPPA